MLQTQPAPLDLLHQVFGELPFAERPDIISIRRFAHNQAYCLNEQQQIIGLAVRGTEVKEVNLLPELQQLQYLNISDNPNLQRIRFPAEGMPELVHLDLSGNALEECVLPEDCGQLERIDISSNQLQSIEFQGTLPALWLLELNGNQLEHFRIDAPALKYAYLIQNQLTKVEFTHPPRQLELLHLRNNRLDELPANILEFTGLKLLYLYGNPLRNLPTESIPQEESSNALAAIRNIYESRRGDTLENDEVKLVLLGNSTVGKSTLLRYLLERDYDDQLSSTHGIENRLWMPAEEDFKVNVWDFGGQEYYHATHRLFLSTNSAALILFEEATNYQGELETTVQLYEENELVRKRLQLEHFPYSYWLDSLHHFSGGKPGPMSTLLVQHKLDLPDARRIRVPDEVLEKYQLPEEHILRISTRGAANEEAPFFNDFAAFQRRLIRVLRDAKASYEISAQWVAIKEQLRELAGSRPLLSKEEYDAFCEEIQAGISSNSGEGESQLDTLTRYLQEIGVILHYPGNTSLKNTVFIDPEWITDVIYRVLDFRVMREEGRFTHQHVERVIGGLDKKGSFDAVQLIALMEKFELIFAANLEEGIYVAPQYLPREKDVRDQKQFIRFRNQCTHLAFILRYPRFLPKSIMTRIICKYGSLSEDTYWRNGIGFERMEGGPAMKFLITCDENRDIHVRTSEGATPQAIKAVFEGLQTISARDPQVLVSCNGDDFVRLKDMEEHPASNQQIQSAEGKWLAISDFSLLFDAHLAAHAVADLQAVKIITPATMRDKTKILFLASNPMETGRLRLDVEYRDIDEALLRSEMRDQFHLEPKFAVRPGDFQSALLKNPNILHFAGHGTGAHGEAGSRSSPGIDDVPEPSGGIILENKQGRPSTVSGEALAGLIELVAENIDCVVLNACYSEEQAKAIIEHVPYVIGMNSAIPDDAAISFATTFYQALGDGRDIEFAFEFGKRSLNLEGLEGAAIPQLLKNEELISTSPPAGPVQQPVQSAEAPPQPKGEISLRQFTRIVEDMLAEDRLKEVVTFMRESLLPDSRHSNTLINIQGQLARLEKKVTTNIITDSDANIARNKLNNSISSILRDIKEVELKSDIQRPE